LESLKKPKSVMTLPKIYFNNIGLTNGENVTFIDTGLYGSHIDSFKLQTDADIQPLLCCADNKHAQKPIQSFAEDKKLDQLVASKDNVLVEKGFLYTLTSTIENFPKKYRSVKTFSMQNGQVMPALELTSSEEQKCHENFYIGLDKGIDKILKSKTTEMPNEYYKSLFDFIKPIKELLDMSEIDGQPESVRNSYSQEHHNAIRDLVSKIANSYEQEKEIER